MIHTISSRFGLFLCFIVLIILVTFYIHHKNEPSGSERNAQILSVSITCDGESLELSELRDYLETNHLESDAVFIIKYSILDCIQCDKEIMNTICHFFSETKKTQESYFSQVVLGQKIILSMVIHYIWIGETHLCWIHFHHRYSLFTKTH